MRESVRRSAGIRATDGLGVLLTTPVAGCSAAGIKVTFWGTQGNAYNDHPLVRELEPYYGE